MSVDDDHDGSPAGAQRLDKWLWFARITKSRTLASALVADGKIRVNRVRVIKPSHPLKVADVITVNAHRKIRILEVSALGHRRGPAAETAQLYRDLTPPPGEQTSAPAAGATTSGIGATAERELGSGRPTKRDRRQIDRLRGRSG